MKTINKKIKLDIKEEVIGAIQSDSISERGVILDVASDCQKYDKSQIGATLYFKAWAIDVITIDQKKHYFISEDSDAILAIE
jgi:hypothetical protein